MRKALGWIAYGALYPLVVMVVAIMAGARVPDTAIDRVLTAWSRLKGDDVS